MSSESLLFAVSSGSGILLLIALQVQRAFPDRSLNLACEPAQGVWSKRVLLRSCLGLHIAG